RPLALTAHFQGTWALKRSIYPPPCASLFVPSVTVFASTTPRVGARAVGQSQPGRFYPRRFEVLGMAESRKTSIEIQRDQSRLRQARKRRRDREVRLDLEARTIADQMPAAWREEFLKLFHKEHGRAGRAKAEIEKALLVI